MKVDMSAKAVATRLKRVSQLRRLCLSLDQTKKNRWMIQEELQQRAEADQRLYEQFGKPLEAEHAGEFVAIARDGRLIVEREQIRALERAVEEFGSGNFAFRRVGARALGRWRTRLGH